eukprot:m.140320 g.140320  ORF g.140320 m.140320 type:complete len:60 (-) comp17658_c0_seq2:1070-1249(-)
MSLIQNTVKLAVVAAIGVASGIYIWTPVIDDIKFRSAKAKYEEENKKWNEQPELPLIKK